MTAIVKSVIGQVVAVSAEGFERVLVEGDRVFANETVKTGAEGAVTLQLEDGRTLDLGRDTQWSDAGGAQDPQVAANQTQSVEALQQAIAAGMDPTQALEATAAGPAAGPTNAGPGAAGGGHTFVMLDETAGSAAPTIGYPTDPLSFEIAAADEIQQPQDLTPAPTPDAPTPDVPPVTVTGITANDTVEGGNLTYQVQLSGATTAATTYPFTFGGGTADESDYFRGQVTFSDGVTYDALNGSVTVPAGVSTFTITLPTVDDTLVEGNEGVPLNIGGLTATGTILDNDGLNLTVADAGRIAEGGTASFALSLDNAVDAPTTITFTLGGEVEPADIDSVSVTIGGTAVAVTQNADGSYSFTLPAGVTTGISVNVVTANDTVYEGNEQIVLTATLSGTTANGTTVTASDSGTGTIVDDGSPVPNPPSDDDRPTLTVGDAGRVAEGGTATFAVSLSNAVDAPTTVTFTLGGEVEPADIASVNVTIGGTAVTVTQNADGSYSFTLPAGVTTGISVNVVTANDTVYEGNEQMVLTATLSGTTANGTTVTASDSGTGTIVDDGSPVPNPPSDDDRPTLTVGDAGRVAEGGTASFAVSLSNAVDAPTTVTFTLGGEVEPADIASVNVTIGGSPVTVTQNADGSYSFTLPAGVTTGISVNVVTANDTVFEGNEQMVLTATLSGTTANGTTVTASDSGTGTIVDDGSPVPNPPSDDDRPTLTVGDAGRISEGGTASFAVSLSNAVDAPTTVTFTLGGEVEPEDISDVTVTIGGSPVTVTQNADGSYSFTLPAGVTTGISVNVVTANDTVYEGNEQMVLTATLSGTTANGTTVTASDSGTGTIVDDGSPVPNPPSDDDRPTLTVGDAGRVAEGGTATFAVSLSNAVDAPTTVTFTLGGEVEPADIASVNVTIGGSPVTVTQNADGSYSFTLPAGVSSGIAINVVTATDSLLEGDELLQVSASLSGTTDNGTPVSTSDTGVATVYDGGSNPNDPQLNVADAGRIAEGATATFAVTLEQAINAPTTITFTLGGEVEPADIDSVNVTIGGSPVTVTQNADGSYSFTLPAGVTTGISVNVVTANDTVYEGNEQMVLTATLSGTTANGTTVSSSDSGTAVVVDDGSPVPNPPSDDDRPTLTVGDAGRVAEGGTASFAVSLSNAVDAPTTVTFTLGGEVEPADIASVNVTIGGSPVTVTQNADGSYSFTLPAGVSTGISVNVVTANDTVFEGNEQMVLTATLSGTTANGTTVTASDSGTGTIVDDGSPVPNPPSDDDRPTLTVGDAGRISEGGTASFAVSLSNAVDAPTTVTFTLGGEVEPEDISGVTVTIGGSPVTVTQNADGSYSFTLPAGVTTGISVNVATTNDTVFEGNEQLVLQATLSGTTANGTTVSSSDSGTAVIVDDGTNVPDPNDPNGPPVPGDNDTPSITVGDAGRISEGGTAVFGVSLDHAVDAPTTVTFTLGGEVEPEDISGVTVTIGGSPVTVTQNADGSYSFTLPAGVTTGISVNVATTNDTVFEGNEQLVLNATLSGTTANGTTVSSTDSGTAVIVDDGTNVPDPNDPNGPPVPGDNDTPTLTVGDAGRISEGGTASFAVSLDHAVDAPTTVTFTLGGEVEPEDISGVTVTIGGSPVTVTQNADGSYSFTLPAGVTTGISVNVATTNDTVFEGNEQLVLNATLSGTTANGTTVSSTDSGTAVIVDDGTNVPDPNDPNGPPVPGDNDTPTLTVGDAGRISEGGTAVFGVSLDHAVDAPTTVTFTLGGEVEPEDISGVTVTIGGSPVTVTQNADGSYSFTLPAGVTTGINVNVATTNDTVFEGNEQLVLNATLSGTTANGTPVSSIDSGTAVIVDDGTNVPNPNDPNGPPVPGDNDTPVLTVSDAGRVAEGATASFAVSLDHAVDAPTTVTFSLGGQIDANDIGTVSVTLDGTPISVTQNADGSYSFSVPAGVTSGFSINVATVRDAVYEGDERIDLQATLTGTTDNGTLVYSTDAATAVIFDRSTPVFDNGNASVAVSEEGLAGGIPDSDGSSDTTNLSTFSGQMSVSDADGDTLSVSLGVPSGSLTSGGVAIAWTLSADGHSLVGKAGNTSVISVSIDDAGNYRVDLLAPLDHPDITVEDVLSIAIPVTVSDGNTSSSAVLTVNVEDDSPSASVSEAVSTTRLDIPDVYTGQVSFTGNGGTSGVGGMSFAGGAVLVTGQGFTSASNLDLIAAGINQTSLGIGVASQGEPYQKLPNEVDFRVLADGSSASELLTLSLTDGKVAYGLSLEFAQMYGGELETGIAYFYRDGQLVATQTFSSDASNGNYAANFRVVEGGFDSVVLAATGNGNGFDVKDNSDFTLTSATFLGTSAPQATDYAQGQLGFAYGADGAGDIVLTGTNETLTTAAGKAVSVSVSNDGNTVTGVDSDGNLAFTVQLTPATGTWEFYQYQELSDGNGNVLNFGFTVTDADGDASNGSFLIQVNSAPVIEADPQPAAVSEEGLSGGIADNDGNPDTTNATHYSGQMRVSDADGDSLSVSLGVPSGTLTSGGVAISWTLSADGHTLVGMAGSTTVLTVSIDDTGAYSVDLSAPLDHPDTRSEDVLSLNLPVTVSDGRGSASSTLSIAIEDDSPQAQDIQQTLSVTHDSLVIANLQAGFINAKFESGNGGKQTYNTDGDRFTDKIEWGLDSQHPSGSSYALVDNGAYTGSGTSVTAGSLFKLGDFTHDNRPISGDAASLDKITLTMTLDVVINGRVTPISFDVLLDHTETPNNDDPQASADIITLARQNVTVNIDGQDYVLRLEGFMDASGQVVTRINTLENASNTFGIYASLDSSASAPSVSGSVAGYAGADGFGQANWAGLGSQTSGSLSNDYGTLTVRADGSYTFTLSRAGEAKLAAEGGSASVSFDYTLTDKDGDSSGATLTLNLQSTDAPLNTPPVIEVDAQPASVSEEGLSGGIADNDGSPDTTNATRYTGQVRVSDADGDALTLSLGVPSASLTSGGVAIAWTLSADGHTLTGKAGSTTVLTVNIDDTGKYSVDLKAPLDHPDTTVEDVLNLNVPVTVSDGSASSTTNLVVAIEDDSPVASDVSQTLEVRTDTLMIGNLQAGFVRPVYESHGSTSGTRSYNTDGDAYKDKIEWGATNSSSGSSYSLVDNASYTGNGTAVSLGTLFKLGEFTHDNQPISGDVASLDKVTLTLSLDVMVNGRVTKVSFDVLLDHTETPNDDPKTAPDIISLPAQDVTVNIAGTDYTFHLQGFMDRDGNIVNTIRTQEGASNSYGIYGSIDYSGAAQTLSGSLAGSAGADGFGHIEWAGLEGKTAGSLSNEYGTLTVKADGSYTFTLSDAGRALLAANGSASPTFAYTLFDKDGDSDSGTLTLNLNASAAPINTAPVIEAEAQPATVSEEGLAGGIKDSEGSSDTTNATHYSGQMRVSDAEGDALSVRLSVPTGELTSGGVKIAWTLSADGHTLTGKAGSTTVLTVNIDDTGKYSVDLKAPLDHPDTTIEDVLSLNVPVTVSDGSASSTTNLVVAIEDDSPVASDIVQSLKISHDTLVIGNLQAGFVNVKYDSTGSISGTHAYNNDGDRFNDKIEWGATGSTPGSSYSLVDNTQFSGNGTTVSLGSLFQLGVFTHDNRPISGSVSPLDKVTLTLSMDVMVNGQKTTVSFDVLLDHTETPNNDDPYASADIISLPPQDVTVRIGDSNYSFHLQGFMDANGNIVNTIHTWENASTSFGIYGSIDYSGAAQGISGSVAGGAGADGFGRVEWSGLEGKTSGSLSNDYGTLTVKADGSYSFTLSDAGRALLAANGSATPSFSYTLYDKDGDSSSAHLTLQLSSERYDVLLGGNDDDTLHGSEANDIIVGDTGGLQFHHGENYNIAFVVDSSGSISEQSLAKMVEQLTQVFQTLQASAATANAGTVNVYLSDFDSSMRSSVSVNLADPHALNTLIAELKGMTSGGYTNYEDALKYAANWFHSAQVSGNVGTNLTYFITDGDPTAYQVGEKENVQIADGFNGYSRSINIDQVYVPGQTITAHIGGSDRVVIDKDGFVYKWTQHLLGWTDESIGQVRAQGNGTYEFSIRAGNGQLGGENASISMQQALAAFALLAGVSDVHAIGLGNDLDAAHLAKFDSDGVVQTQIDPADLAQTILGSSTAEPHGADTLIGDDGDDILFGDSLTFDGIAGEGFKALQAFVAEQTGNADANSVTTQDVHAYVSANSAAFDHSGALDGNDVLQGGAGDDILYGQGGDDKLYGGAGNDILYGGDGNDLLDGGAGNDILFGGAGDDILIGGPGDDILTGGLGADVFKWQAGDLGHDIITDFNPGEGDQIDLSGLLQSMQGSDNLDQFLRLINVDGVETLQVSTTGQFTSDPSSSANADVSISLEGHSLPAGVSSSDAINSLIDSHALKVD